MALEQLSCTGTIEVTGSGEVEVSPDQAVISLTVITQAKTAAAASAANAERTAAVVAAVAAETHSGITTAGLGVSPITRFDPEINVRRIIGYRATNSVEVTTAPAQAGRIYDVGVAAGANQSSGVSFRVADERPHRAEALRRAVAQAEADARVVAEAAALTLLGPRSVEIDPGPVPVGYRAAALAADTPVVPDDVSVAASVRFVMATAINSDS